MDIDDFQLEWVDEDEEPGSGYTPQEVNALLSVPLNVVQAPIVASAADGTESLYANLDGVVDAETYGSDRGLRNYWTHGEGAVKIRWGTPGDFDRCVAHLGKYVKNPQGLCNEYHVEAVGAPPGKGHDVTTETFAVEPVAIARVGSDNPNSIAWDGVLAIEGEETGDGRMFASGSLTWAELPLPLMYQYETSHGGTTDKSTNVGNITEIWRDGNKIMGCGTIDLDDQYGVQAARKMRGKYLRGVSIDADSVKETDVELVYAQPDPSITEEAQLIEMIAGSAPELTIFHNGRVRGATLVNLPAFVGASLNLTGDLSMLDDSMVATGNRRYVRDPDGRFKDIPGVGDDDENGVTRTARDVTDTITSDSDNDELGDVVYDGVVDSEDEPVGRKKKRPQYVDPDHDYHVEVITAAAANGKRGYTIEIPELPPLGFFEEPTDLPPIGAVWIEPNGHIYGLVGPSDVAHRAFRNKKVTIPMGNVDYTRWMNRPTPVIGYDGEIIKIRTGVITMNCGHMNPYGSSDPEDRMKHYDNSCSIAAVVRVGESKHHKAPWISGTIMPMSVADFQRFQACQLSGDWAPHRERRGWKEFVASLAVPVPGFARSTNVAAVRLDDNSVVVASSVPINLTSDAYDEETDMSEGLTSATTESNRLALGRIRANVGASNRQALDAIRRRVGASTVPLTASAATPTVLKVKKVGCTPCAAKRARDGQTSAQVESPVQVSGFGEGDGKAAAAQSVANAIANTRGTSRG